MEKNFYFETDQIGLLHIVLLPNDDIKGLDWMIDGWLVSDVQGCDDFLKKMNKFLQDKDKLEETLSGNAYDFTMRKDYCTITSIFDCYADQYCTVPTSFLYEILCEWTKRTTKCDKKNNSI